MQTKQYFDQLSRLVEFHFPPKRIISLVPSQTELLFDLGLEETVVGITKFCIHPVEWHTSKTKIGGTKNLNFDLIDQLKPDLIIGNKEENDEEGIKLPWSKYAVWMSDVVSWPSALQMISQVGSLVNEELNAKSLIAEVEKRFERIKKNKSLKTLYLIWQKPWMAVGKNTFIDTMLSKIGLENIVSKERYPEFSLEELRKLSPELVLLSSEPFPFREKHIHELTKILPNSRIILVDGEMFSWYGSRLLKAPVYFSSLNL